MKTGKRNRLTVVLFAVYMLLLAGIILFKLPFYSEKLSDGVRVVNLIPLQGSYDENGVLRLSEIVDNILLFIPLGIYICLLRNNWSFIKKVLPVIGLSLAFEAIEYIFAIGRSDVTDLIGNTLGGVIGIGIGAVLFKIFKSWTVGVVTILALVVTGFVVWRFGNLFYLSHFVMGRPAGERESSAIGTLVSAPPFNEASEDMLLVNAGNPLPKDYRPRDLVNLYEQNDKHFALATADIELSETVFEAMNEMFAAAQKDGAGDVIITSGYRSYEEQEEVFDATTDGTAAKPGESEHETGLAFDVAVMGEEDFERTPQFAWLLEHCAEYGFILRYPKGMEDVTGYPYEPWHYRYVGREQAEDIMSEGITLEQYCSA